MKPRRREQQNLRCKVEGCDRPAWTPGSAKGLCSKHYQMQRTHGRTERVTSDDGHLNKTLGYVEVYVDGVKKYQHVVVAETALGKPLPKGAEVHHWNEIRSDNRPENLVVCPDHSYHMLLHRRARKLGITFGPGEPFRNTIDE